MTVGFFTVFRTDPQHYLHATSLVREVSAVMPGVEIVQFTDETTPAVIGVSAVRRLPHGPMLERRLEHYASVDGEWLLVDTDVSIRKDVRDVFASDFEVALTDRDWPHLPQEERFLQTMPFNTGIVFTRCQAFWRDVLQVWRSYPEAARDWLSEQRAVYACVRAGAHRVKILPGQIYNYPPASDADANPTPAIYHYKGPRKSWLSKRAYQTLATPDEVLA